MDLIRTHANAPLRRAISVGCGTGVKEIDLLKNGIVDVIEGYDLAPGRIDVARKNAEAAGVGDRAQFFCENGFEKFHSPTFDLVYWNNALHHMPNVREAIRWSKAVLHSGGVFAMDEYVGPSRFVISDDELRFVNEVRASLPRDVFVKPNGRGHLYPRAITREWLASLIAKDPSEAVDAGVTLSAIHETFPQATISAAGGMLYFLALNGLYSALRTEEGAAILRLVLMLDRESVASGRVQTLYGTAIAVKV
jgi:SAM-dependent methyltransferase